MCPVGLALSSSSFHGRSTRDVVLLDAREIDPSPEGFEHAVLVALGERAGSGRVTELLAGAVLLVDGYEQLGPIDGWLRQAFLPALPADVLVAHRAVRGRGDAPGIWLPPSAFRDLRDGNLEDGLAGE